MKQIEGLYSKNFHEYIDIQISNSAESINNLNKKISDVKELIEKVQFKKVQTREIDGIRGMPLIYLQALLAFLTGLFFAYRFGIFSDLVTKCLKLMLQKILSLY